MEEKKLIELIKKDSQKGISVMIDLYGTTVHTVCRKILYGCDESYIEDSMQDCFVNVWRHIAKGNKINKSLKAFICQVARNSAMDTYKKYAKEKHISTDQMLYESVESLVWEVSENFENDVERKRDYDIVHQVISEMDEPDKTIFLLRFFYNFKVKDIAKKVNLTEENVENRLRRKKKKLQEKLQERGVTYGKK